MDVIVFSDEPANRNPRLYRPAEADFVMRALHPSSAVLYEVLSLCPCVCPRPADSSNHYLVVRCCSAASFTDSQRKTTELGPKWGHAALQRRWQAQTGKSASSQLSRALRR